MMYILILEECKIWEFEREISTPISSGHDTINANKKKPHHHSYYYNLKITEPHWVQYYLQTCFKPCTKNGEFCSEEMTEQS